MAAARRSNLAVVTSEDGWETPPPLGQELGSTFGYNDRLFFGWNEDGTVFDYGDFVARDIKEMIKRDYKARQIESVLALPIMSAEREIKPTKGDKGEAEFLTNYWTQTRSTAVAKPHWTK